MIQKMAQHTAASSTEVSTTPVGATSWHYFAIIGVLGLFLAFFFRDPYLGTALHPIQTGIASITTALLGFIDIQVIQKSTILVHSGGFACEITPGCTGIIPLVLYIVAVLMYPARSSQKACGLILGILFLVGFNFVRLVHLVYLGTHHPSWFDIMHWVVWQSLIALAVVAAWWIWTGWVRRRAQRAHR